MRMSVLSMVYGCAGAVVLAPRAPHAALSFPQAASNVRHRMDAVMTEGRDLGAWAETVVANINEGDVGSRGELWFFGQLGFVGLVLAAPCLNIVSC